MDRDTIRRMDTELYQEKLEEAVMDDVSCILNVNKGHSSTLHTDISIDDMITRMVKEEKQAVSSFYDAETLVSTLQDAIYYKAKEISNWITSEKIDFKEHQNYHTLAFTLDMGDDPVGHGITIDGRELATTMTTVVLQRDFSDESPFGFFVKTAYVDIFHERAEETGLRVNIPDFIQNKMPFTSNIEKAYHCLKHEYPDKKIWLQNNKGNSEIKISEDNGDNKYIAYISELGTKIKKAEIDHIRTASSLECYLECPKLTEMLTYADNVTHNRNKTQSKKQDITH